MTANTTNNAAIIEKLHAVATLLGGIFGPRRRVRSGLKIPATMP